jgi:hypothetical protein
MVQLRCGIGLFVVLAFVLFPVLSSTHSTVKPTSESVLATSVDEFALTGNVESEIWYFPIVDGAVQPGHVLHEFEPARVAGLGIFDYENDLDLDFVALILPAPGGEPSGEIELYLFKNVEGTFEITEIPHTLPASGGYWVRWSRMAAADFYKDGYCDFGVSVVDDGPTKLYLFTYDPVGDAFVQSHIGDATWATHAYTMGAGDANEDGFQDFLTFDYVGAIDFSDDVFLYSGDGAGGFAASYACSTIHSANDLTVGDFDNDGCLDLIVGLDDDGDPGGAWLYVGDCTGNFRLTDRTPVFDLDPLHNSGYDHNTGAGWMDAFDVDKDENLDLLAYVYGSDHDPFSPKLLFIKGNGDGTFEDAVLIHDCIGEGAGASSICAPVKLEVPPPDARGLKAGAIEALEALKPTGGNKLDKEIDKAIRNVERSLDENYWLGNLHLDSKHGHEVFSEEKRATVRLVREMKKRKFPAELEDDFLALINMLLNADMMIAQTAIDDAIVAGADPDQIARAEEEMENAQEKRDEGEYTHVIDHYRKVWEHALKAIKKGARARNEQITVSERGLPGAFSLLQISPNPVTSSGTIRYLLAEDCYVSLDVYNIAGRKVVTLVDEHQEAGFRSVDLDAAESLNGVYFYRLVAGDLAATRKMIVLK